MIGDVSARGGAGLSTDTAPFGSARGPSQPPGATAVSDWTGVTPGTTRGYPVNQEGLCRQHHPPPVNNRNAGHWPPVGAGAASTSRPPGNIDPGERCGGNARRGGARCGLKCYEKSRGAPYVGVLLAKSTTSARWRGTERCGHARTCKRCAPSIIEPSRRLRRNGLSTEINGDRVAVALWPTRAYDSGWFAGAVSWWASELDRPTRRHVHTGQRPSGR